MWQQINHHLPQYIHVAEAREASPSAGVIDSQSVKTTERGSVRGYNTRRKITGCKRHIITGTCGYLVHAVIHNADIQNRDNALIMLKDIHYRLTPCRRCIRLPWLLHAIADARYAGEKLRAALNKIGLWHIEIIKRSDQAKGFEIRPRGWVFERAFAWLSRNRRLA